MRALTLTDRGGDDEIAAQAEYVLGHVEYAVGSLTEAQRRFTHSIETFRKGKTPWGAGSALAGLAWGALATGDARQAEHLLDEATSRLRNAGPWFLSLVSYLRALLAVRRGEPDEAIALVRESLTRIRALQDKFAFVYALVPLAAAAALKGDDAWAARILGARDAATERTGATFIDNPVHDLLEQAQRETRARLGATRWTLAYDVGRRSSIDALMTDIDRVVARHAPADAESAE
jgi:tetratricopeptide (TPR) repeat protein